MSTRETVLIPTAQGKIEAWVYTPQSAVGKLPVVVLGCGVGAVKAAGLHPFAQAFCDAGYAAVAFDYLTFGGSEGRPRHVVIVWDEYRDFTNVISWARQQNRFDPSRVVAWGTSFGGMHVTRLLAEDSTIAAGIAQCPCVDAALASRMKPIMNTIRLSFWTVCDFIASLIGASPIYVRAANSPPGQGLALMDAPDVADGWRLLHKSLEGQEADPFSNRIAARSLLSFPISRPALAAHKIIAPYLIVVPTHDSVAPKHAAEDVARKASKGELVEVPGGHFDLYRGGVGFEKNLEAQLEFLKRVIPV